MSEGAGSFVAVVTACAVIALGLLFGLPAACGHVKDYQRTQARLDANNRVKINRTKIQYYQQQEGIERKKADIRVIHAEGIRKAQDKIAATLTPLYVQFEMIQALRAGGAHTVYIPTDPAGGLPVVTTRNAGGK